MLMGELATIAKYRLPIKIIVVKNNSFGMIKWEQIAFEGNPQYGVDLHAIDFVQFAHACGVVGYSVSDPACVTETLQKAFGQPGPVLIEAVVDPHEPPLPGKITTDQAWQFTKSMARGEKERVEILKTVLENKIREVV
jgi:pyruvate dehydrogenase (quinone)